MFLSEQLLQGALSQHHPSTPKIPIEVTVAVDGTTAPTTAADSIVAALTQTLTNDPPRAASSTKHQNEQNWSQSLSAFGKIDSISIPQSIGSMMGDVPLDLQVPLLVLVAILGFLAVLKFSSTSSSTKQSSSSTAPAIIPDKQQQKISTAKTVPPAPKTPPRSTRQHSDITPTPLRRSSRLARKVD